MKIAFNFFNKLGRKNDQFPMIEKTLETTVAFSAPEYILGRVSLKLLSKCKEAA